MSTHCVITVTDADQSFSIYKHSDGYPEGEHGVLAQLERVLPLAWPLTRYEAGDFAAAVVAALKDGPGHIYLCVLETVLDACAYHYVITKPAGTGDAEYLHIEVRVSGDESDDDDKPIAWTVQETAYLPALGPLGTLAADQARKPARKPRARA